MRRPLRLILNQVHMQGKPVREEVVHSNHSDMALLSFRAIQISWKLTWYFPVDETRARERQCLRLTPVTGECTMSLEDLTQYVPAQTIAINEVLDTRILARIPTLAYV